MKTNTKRISEKSLGLLVFGETLIALSLGSIYSLRLVSEGYYIFIAASLLSVSYINSTLLIMLRSREASLITYIVGFTGGFLLALFFGIQSPQLPFKNIVLLAGALLLLPTLKDLTRRKGA